MMHGITDRYHALGVAGGFLKVFAVPKPDNNLQRVLQLVALGIGNRAASSRRMVWASWLAARWPTAGGHHPRPHARVTGTLRGDALSLGCIRGWLRQSHRHTPGRLGRTDVADMGSDRVSGSRAWAVVLG